MIPANPYSATANKLTYINAIGKVVVTKSDTHYTIEATTAQYTDTEVTPRTVELDAAFDAALSSYEVNKRLVIKDLLKSFEE